MGFVYSVAQNYVHHVKTLLKELIVQQNKHALTYEHISLPDCMV